MRKEGRKGVVVSEYSCEECGHSVLTLGECPSCCPQCGGVLRKLPPAVGKPATLSVYTLQFTITEAFPNEAAARTAAAHAKWDGGNTVTDYTLERVGTAVPEEEYPYICGECGEQVTSDPTGRCGNCGVENSWEKR